MKKRSRKSSKTFSKAEKPSTNKSHSSKTSTNKVKQRDKYLQRTYGITLKDYERMLQEQGESCAVCKKHQSYFKNSLAVDHNHKTSKTRGLLCYYCNRRLIGRHTIDTAVKVLTYLTRYDDNPLGVEVTYWEKHDRSRKD